MFPDSLIMAWKKIAKYSNKRKITWNKGEIDVVFSDMRNSPVPDERYPFSVLVARVDSSGEYEHLISKYFATRVQAMSFARNYMRKH